MDDGRHYWCEHNDVVVTVVTISSGVKNDLVNTIAESAIPVHARDLLVVFHDLVSNGGKDSNLPSFSSV